MVKIKHKSKPMHETIRVSKILGKKVLSKKGKSMGTVGEIYIHPKNMTLEGIKVKKPLFVGNDYIGKNYIKEFTEKRVMLDIIPITEMPGKTVLDASGKKVGKINVVTRTKKTNSLQAFKVNRGIGKKDVVFLNSDIKSIGENVVLNKKFEE